MQSFFSIFPPLATCCTLNDWADSANSWWSQLKQPELYLNSKLLHFSPHLAPMMIKVILLTEDSCPSRGPMEHPADVRMMASWFRMGQILSVPQTKSTRCEGNSFQRPFRLLLLLNVIFSCHIVKAITEFSKVTLPIMHL